MGGRLTSHRSLQVRYTSLEAFNFSIRCGELSYNLGSKAFFLRAELKDLKQILCAVFDLGLNQEPVTKRFQLCCVWGTISITCLPDCPALAVHAPQLGRSDTRPRWLQSKVLWSVQASVQARSCPCPPACGSHRWRCRGTTATAARPTCRSRHGHL